MIDQINQSIDFDCDVSYWEKETYELLTGEKWLSKRRDELMRSLVYHKKEDLEERNRVAGRNEWISALRKSLSPSLH